jgi:hypothetical protein
MADNQNNTENQTPWLWKAQLAAKHAASKDHFRPELNGIAVYEDGTTVATDGRIAVVIEGRGNAVDLATKPMALITPQMCRQLPATVFTERDWPVKITQDSDGRTTIADSHGNKAISELTPDPKGFANWVFVLDHNKLDSKWRCRTAIKLGVKLLQKLLRVYAAAGVEEIDFRIHDSLETIITYGQTKENKQDVIGALMPLRADNGKPPTGNLWKRLRPTDTGPAAESEGSTLDLSHLRAAIARLEEITYDAVHTDEWCRVAAITHQINQQLRLLSREG